MIHPVLKDIVFCHDSPEAQYYKFSSTEFRSSEMCFKVLFLAFGGAFSFLFFSFFFLIPLIRNSFSVSIYSC